MKKRNAFLALTLICLTSCKSTGEYELTNYPSARISIYCLDEKYNGHCVEITDSAQQSLICDLFDDNLDNLDYYSDVKPHAIGQLYISVNRYSVWFDDGDNGFSWGMEWNDEDEKIEYYLSNIYDEETMTNAPRLKASSKDRKTYLMIQYLYESQVTEKNKIHSSAPFLPRMFEYE